MASSVLASSILASSTWRVQCWRVGSWRVRCWRVQSWRVRCTPARIPKNDIPLFSSGYEVAANRTCLNADKSDAWNHVYCTPCKPLDSHTPDNIPCPPDPWKHCKAQPCSHESVYNTSTPCPIPLGFSLHDAMFWPGFLREKYEYGDINELSFYDASYVDGYFSDGKGGPDA